MPKVLITGINGQDGSILARKFLSNRNYEVHGLVRRTSQENLTNLEGFLDCPELILHRGDILETGKIERLIANSEFDYIYHEADQDNVGYSFENPASSLNVTIQGTLNVLDAVPPSSPTRIFIPCSSTMFGPCTEPQTLDTPFNPQSPYAAAKVTIFHLCRIYRTQKNLRIHAGILYNHDSERRNGDYLLHRICKAIVKGTPLTLGMPDERVCIADAYKTIADIVQVMEFSKDSEFLVGSMDPISIRSLVDTAYDVMRKEFNIELPARRVIAFNDLPPREGVSSVLMPAISLFSHFSRTNYQKLCYNLLLKYGAKL